MPFDKRAYMKEYLKRYRKEDKYKKYVKEFYNNNRERLLQEKKEHREANREELLEKKSEWYFKNADRVKARVKDYRDSKPEWALKVKQQWRKKDPDRIKKWGREYNRKWLLNKKEKEAGRSKPVLCEITNLPAKITFDHCHKSGEFRGWISDQCNRIAGQANDDFKLLRLVADYLEKWENGQRSKQEDNRDKVQLQGGSDPT